MNGNFLKGDRMHNYSPIDPADDEDWTTNEEWNESEDEGRLVSEDDED